MDVVLGYSFSVPLDELPSSLKPLELVWIPPGTFLMGCPSDALGCDPWEDGPPFEMTISKGYWLGRYPVTQAQWEIIMKDNPSEFKHLSPDCPVDNVNWHQAMAFCGQLNEQLSEKLPVGYEFTLPTEAQWEYACRAGNQSPPSGKNTKDLSRVAWHRDNSLGHTHPVGEKAPNDWMLYDMLGNVMEWCFDSPSAYPQTSAVDWIGEGSGKVRNIRGGSWATIPSDSSFCCMCRVYVEPSGARASFGVRLCVSWRRQ